MLYNVMAKDQLVNFKMEGETRDALHVAAKLRGLTVSALLHSFAIQTIREERERNPRAFADLLSALWSKPKGKTSKVHRGVPKQSAHGDTNRGKH